MNKYAHIENGIVTNISLWDGETAWDPGCDLVKLDEGSAVDIGWEYRDGAFVTPELVVEDNAEQS